MENHSAEIITVGSELLLGRFADTNAAWLSKTLSDKGLPVKYRTTVGDIIEDMTAVFKQALERTDVVIVTGGLGPTDDDLTRAASAEVAGVDLVLDEGLLADIETMFKRIGFTMTDNNRRQAYLPAGATALNNPIGTAPGFAVDVGGSILIAVPGVPREMELMVKGLVMPMLAERLGLESDVVLTRLLKTCGLGESGVDERLRGLLGEDRNPAVGLLSSPGEVRVRLTAGGGDDAEARRLLDRAEAEVRDRLGELIYGVDGDTLEGVGAAALTEAGAGVAVVETCTGGGVCRRLVRAGSDRLVSGWVLPDLKSVAGFFGSDEIDHTDGPAMAALLAERARNLAGRDGIGLAVWGLTESLGDGGPSGEVRIDAAVEAYSARGRTGVARTMSGPRAWVMDRLTAMGLDVLRRHLTRAKGGDG